MRTTMSDALTAYSHQRAGLIRRATFARYQRLAHGLTAARWSIAASSRKTAAASQSTRTLPRRADP
jgi:predicted phage tail protein